MAMSPVAVLPVVAGLVLLVIVCLRDRRAARMRQLALFDACTGLLHDPRIATRGAGYPYLIGSYRGFRVELHAMAEALAPRKLPSLWLFVRVRVARPGAATLDMLMRPLGVEFWSPSADLPYRIETPAGWPADVVIRTDDPVQAPPLESLDGAARLLRDPRGKEVAVGPCGVRLVWQAAEGERGGYLLLRRARFGLTRLDPAIVRALLDRAVALAEGLRGC